MNSVESEVIFRENLMEIRCQIDKCPFGMPPNSRCCFGEVAREDVVGPVKEYHQCKKSKMIVKIVVSAA